MKFDILKRWSSEVRFTVEIDCAVDAPRSLKIGLAIKAAYKLGVSLRDSDLRGSDLRGSNLRGSNLRDSDLSGSNLRDSDLSGSNLRGSNLRDSDLSGSNLRDSDLSGSDLSGSNLRDSNLSGSNLSGSNLRGSNLRDSDLRGSNLSGSNLSGSNLRGSNLRGVPVVPNLNQKILAAIEAGGGFDMTTWHTCDTTHCRAGWAIQLAGDAGAALEFGCGSASAGALIYVKSCPWMEKVPDFYASNEVALADIRACAEREKEEAAKLIGGAK